MRCNEACNETDIQLNDSSSHHTHDSAKLHGAFPYTLSIANAPCPNSDLSPVISDAPQRARYQD